MILGTKRMVQPTVLLVWFAIASQVGCSSSEPPLVTAPPKSLEEILRDSVKKAAAGAKWADEETPMIVDVASKAFGADGAGIPHGELVIHSESPVEKGRRKFVASWRRTLEFELQSASKDSLEIVWAEEGGMSGTTIDLSNAPPGLVDISKRLKDAKNLRLTANDPLQQALTLSGYPDHIKVTAITPDKYRAEIETANAELVVDDSTLISARLQKKE